MDKREFQTVMLTYLQKRLSETDLHSKERTVQMAVLMSMLYDLADADSYNYKRILYTLYPELKPKNNK